MYLAWYMAKFAASEQYETASAQPFLWRLFEREPSMYRARCIGFRCEKGIDAGGAGRGGTIPRVSTTVPR